MGTVQNVFSRNEIKFIVDQAQYKALTDFLKAYTHEDTYGRYTVGNTYFDTPDHMLVRRSLEKPVYKEKLRVRCYTVPDKDTDVFVELKKKFKGVVYKRRVVMTMEEAGAYLISGKKPSGSDQILSEIDWFLNLYHPKPYMYLAYDRIAFTGKKDPTLRITFDSNIRWRTCDTDLSCGTWGKKLLDDGLHVLEIKICGCMPLWLADKLSELGVFKTSFSKYGRCFLKEMAESAGIEREDGAPGKIIDIADARGFVPNALCEEDDGRKTIHA